MLYIVPGFPKCGSTFLRKKVYPHLKTIKYLHMKSMDDCFRESTRFDLSLENFGISNEHHHLIHHVGFSHVLNPVLSKISHRNSLYKLLSMVPDETKIIFQIRRQDKVTQSFFQSCAPSIITKPFDIFLDFPIKEIGNRTAHKLGKKIGMIQISSFNYFTVIDAVASFKNAENVHVMVLEELQDTPKIYFEKLSNIFNEDIRFLATESNHKVNVSNTHRIRYPNWIRTALGPSIKYLKPIKKYLPNRKVLLSSKERDLILHYFADSNLRLSNEFNLDLGRFGYF